MAIWVPASRGKQPTSVVASIRAINLSSRSTIQDSADEVDAVELLAGLFQGFWPCGESARDEQVASHLGGDDLASGDRFTGGMSTMTRS